VKEEPKVLQMIARCYLDMQQMRTACDHRIIKLYERGADPDSDLVRLLQAYKGRLKGEEEWLLKEAKPYVEKHPLWEYCGRVKGLGRVAALMFLGFINPHKATSAAKLWSYAMLTPKSKLVSGEKAKGNPLFKGRCWLAIRNIIMARDEMYYAVYQAKKDYYLHTKGEVEYVKNPKLCPRYEECRRRLLRKATRLGREPKKFPCRGHINEKARRWTLKLLLSHVLEIMREWELLPVDHMRSHWNYIRPKPEDFNVQDQWFINVLENIRSGVRNPKWK